MRLRHRVLAAALLTGSAMALAPAASAQGSPGFGFGFGPPTPGYGGVPMVPSGAPARPTAQPSGSAVPNSCRQRVAWAAYPLAVQLVQYANAFQAYPMGPNGRPLLAPTPLLYPGFAGSLYTPLGAPGYNLANIYGLQNANGILLQRQAFAPVLSGALTYPDLVAHVFSADRRQLAEIGNRLRAADLNANLTIFPLEVAARLKEALDGLQIYAESACTEQVPASDIADDSPGGN